MNGIKLGEKSSVVLHLGTLVSLGIFVFVAATWWHSFTNDLDKKTEAVEERAIQAQESIEEVSKTVREISNRQNSRAPQAWQRYPQMDKWVDETKRLNPEWDPFPVNKVAFYNPETGRFELPD